MIHETGPRSISLHDGTMSLNKILTSVNLQLSDINGVPIDFYSLQLSDINNYTSLAASKQHKVYREVSDRLSQGSN